MIEPPALSPAGNASAEHWTARFSRPVIFVIITLIAIGVYLAFTISVAVFPSTDFPRIVVGIDNGVAPINQMEVMVTRPIEEAMNSVPGLQSVRSTTSRGSAEVNLFFDWNVDMFQTLQYVNAALARVQTTLPATAKLTANRLTFAAFPILAYSLTSDTLTQAQLWELANYSIKPRLNRVNGVSMVVLQGGQVPEFHIVPDPAKLLQAQVTVPAILDAVTKTNMIDSPGLIENNHELALTLVTGQTKDPAEIGNIVVRTTPNGQPIRIADIADVNPSVMPVYTMVTANGTPAVLLNIFRQPDSNTVAVADASHRRAQSDSPDAALGRQGADVLRSIHAGARFHQQRSRRHSDRPDSGRHHSGSVPARLGQFAGGGPGDSGHHRHHADRDAHDGSRLQPDDAGRPGGGGGPGDRRRHRGGREHRDASRFRPEPRGSHSQRAARDSRAAGGIDHHAHRGVSSADHHHRRHRNVFPRPGDHRGNGAAHFAGPGRHLDADAQPLFPAPHRIRQSHRLGRRARPRRGHRVHGPRDARLTSARLRFVLAHPMALARRAWL